MDDLETGGAETSEQHHPVSRALGALAVVLVLGCVTWALFHFVVTDARLVLEYVQALAWPAVVVVGVFWLRAPIRQKLLQLLKVNALGASAEFSPEAQGQRLDQELHSDLSNLFGPRDQDRGPEEQSEDADQAPGQPEEGSPEAEESSVVDQPEDPHKATQAAEEARQDLEGGSDANTPDDAPSPEVATGHPISESAGESGLSVRHLADLLNVARQLGVSSKHLKQSLTGAKDDPEGVRSRVLEILLAEAQRSRALRDAAAHRQEDTRESVESVVRKSAAWGYDMGRAGAPKTTPDIEWNEDGTWRITTQVPPRPEVDEERAAQRAESLQRQQRQQRSIAALEDEIKKLERQRHSPSALSLPGLGNDRWLHDLKSRLRRIDPGNPWTT